jgi:hypothetical protein
VTDDARAGYSFEERGPGRAAYRLPAGRPWEDSADRSEGSSCRSEEDR